MTNIISLGEISNKLYGTDSHVMSLDVLANGKKSSVILNTGQYQSEIEDQLRQKYKQIAIIS
jgi:hypothetical protein